MFKIDPDCLEPLDPNIMEHWEAYEKFLKKRGIRITELFPCYTSVAMWEEFKRSVDERQSSKKDT